MQPFGTHPPPSAAPWIEVLAGRHGRHWSLPAARRYCRGLLGKRDPILTAWLEMFDPGPRDALAAVYACLRLADDFADEEEFWGQRQVLLRRWEGLLERCLAGRADHPAWIALGAAIDEFELPVGWVRAALAGSRLECDRTRVDRWAQLTDLAAASSAPIGRLVLHLLGLALPEQAACSDRLCVALRLTTGLQNLSRELGRGRLLLPAEDLARHGLTERDLVCGQAPASATALIRELVGRIRVLYRQALPLVVDSGRQAFGPLAAAWLGGRCLLRLVDRAGAGVLRAQPALSASSLTRAVLGAGFERLTLQKRLVLNRPSRVTA